MELKKGMKFYSQWFPSEVEVIEVREADNDLVVWLETFHEVWNLEHTKWGFERGEYFQTQAQREAEKKV